MTMNESRTRLRRLTLLILTPVVTTLTALGLRLLLDDHLGDGTPYLLFFSAIMISGWFGGWRSALLATVLSALIADYFFIAPAFSLGISRQSDWIRLILFLGDGVMISAVCELFHRAFGKAQEARRGAEEAERLALIRSEALRNLQEGVLVTDTEGRLVFTNPSAERMHSHAGELMPGRNIRDLHPAFETLRTASDPGPVEWRNLRLDGSEFSTRTTLSRLKAGGKSYHVFVQEDVTLQRQAETQIREQRDQLEIILKGVTDGITALNPEGRFVYANEAGARMCGYAGVSEFLSAPTSEIMKNWEIFDEDGRPFPTERLPGRQALQGVREPAEVVIRSRSKLSGAESWSIINARPVFDSEGKVRFAISIFRDFTHRKKIEDFKVFVAEAASLLGSSLEVKTTLSQLTHLVVPKIADWCTVHLAGEDGSIPLLAVAHTDPNKIQLAREVSTKYPPNPSAENGIPAVIRTGRAELLDSIADEVLQAGARDQEHLEILREVGLTSYLCVPLRGRHRILGCITFLMAESGRKFSEFDLRLAEELADRAALAIENAQLFGDVKNLNRLKDEFLATLSHELRTPLNVIHGHAELLLSDEDLPPRDARKSLEAIHRNARLQTRIVEDLLDVSAMITGQLRLQPSPVSPSEIIESVVTAVGPTVQLKGLWLSTNLETDCKIEADPTRFHQILWNLVSNAIKFTPSGGEIRLSCRQEQDRCLIEISDNGIGIDPTFLPHVFDRFKQEDSSASRAFGGLGLGLAISKHLTESHGGSIRAESEGKGKGTRMTLSFPVLEHRPSPTPPVANEPTHGIAREEREILVIDDSEDGRALVEAFLTRAGFRTLTAGNTREARAILSRTRPAAILCDIGLPEEDGLSFIRWVRRQDSLTGSFIPALALTAYVRVEEREAALQAGFQGHVSKPVNKRVLLEALESVLENPPLFISTGPDAPL